MHLNTDKQIVEYVLTSGFIHEVMCGKLDNTQEAYEQYIEEVMVRTRAILVR